MRTYLPLLLLSVGFTAAQPARQEHEHEHRAVRHWHHAAARANIGEQSQEVKRDVVNVVTEVVQEEVIVFENPEGDVVSTSISYGMMSVETPAAAIQAAPPPDPSPDPSPSPSSTSSASSSSTSSTSSVSGNADVQDPTPVAAAAASTDDSSSSNAPLNGPGFTSGVTYSQYTASGDCRTADQVNTDVAALLGHGHDLIRIYGTDCNGPANLFAAIKGKPVSMFLGIYDIGSANDEASSLISQLNSDWSQVNTVSVGNEVVNDGLASVDAVTGAVSSVRTQLRAAGYTGPVVTVDTMVAVLAHPELCTASDYCAINCHAFFDGGYVASAAGDFVQMFVGKVAGVVSGKTVVVTETGWPAGGSANSAAVPGPSDQTAAINSLKSAFSSNMILFSAFNEYWAQNTAGTFDTEQTWGIYGDSPSTK